MCWEMSWLSHTLAKSWETIATVRGRFRKNLSWLQWPVPNNDTDLDDLHEPCTRAVELNVEVLRHMVVDLEGCSIDVKTLQLEACSNFILLRGCVEFN